MCLWPGAIEHDHGPDAEGRQRDAGGSPLGFDREFLLDNILADGIGRAQPVRLDHGGLRRHAALAREMISLRRLPAGRQRPVQMKVGNGFRRVGVALAHLVPAGRIDEMHEVNSVAGLDLTIAHVPPPPDLLVARIDLERFVRVEQSHEVIAVE